LYLYTNLTKIYGTIIAISDSLFRYKIMRFHSFFSRSFLFCALWLLPLLLKAQDNDTIPAITDAVNTGSKIFVSTSAVDYSAIDNRIGAIKRRYKKISDLATDLTAGCTSDEDKVRAIFIWITNNISYDCAEFHSRKDQNIRFTYKTQAELDAKRRKYYSDYATRVLRSRKAICEGYAVLFQELCQQSNIQCEIVVGRVSVNTNMIDRIRGKKNFSTNHAWDKVKISGTWYYADATWASGYCDKGVKKFTKNFNAYYYLTPVDKLYLTHAENEKQTEKRNNAIAKIK